MSTALADLKNNLTEIDDLIGLCSQPKRGRPTTGVPTEAISRSCIVLMVAFWEHYVECVAEEAADFLEANCTSFQAKPWFRTTFDKSATPNAGNVERLLGSVLGFIEPISSITWKKMGTPHKRLKGLLGKRHAVAHTGKAASKQWKSVVTRDRTFVESLATRLDERIAIHVQNLSGIKPW